MNPSIFVFGSNLSGIHGAGAARHAFDKLGAQWGRGIGRTGDCYAIPTKDTKIRTMPLRAIQPHVHEFRQYARQHPELSFFVTRIGCGLAGFSDAEIGPMFNSMPANVILPMEWEPYVCSTHMGTYHEWEKKNAQTV